MNRKISVGMTVTIVILAMTVTFSITMLLAMRLFDHTVTSVKEKESMYNKVAEVDRYVRANDYYDIDETVLYDRLTAGYLLGTGDKYARYYTASAYTDLLNAQSGKLMGIGVELAIDQSGYAKVIKVYDESPAKEAGLQRGDYITTIDGADIKSLGSVEAVQNKLRGESGTSVNVGWLDSENAQHTADLTHSGFTANSVDSALVQGNVGYIKIWQFDNSTPSELDFALRSLTASGDTGICLLFGSSESGSGTPRLAVSDNAIVRANSGISDNSSADIQIGADSSGNTGGIVFDGNEGTVYGSVTLQEDLEIGEDESLKLDDGASLNAGGHNVIVDGGTVDESIKTSLGGSVKYAPSITTTNLPNGTVGTSYSQALAADGTSPITWSVTSGSLPAGLSFNESTGEITGTPTAEGSSAFTVKAENSYGSDSKELSITINEPATISVTGVSLDQNTLTLVEDGTAQLTATVEPANATNKDVTWSSDDEAVATVDADGKVTAVGAGNATITVTTEDGSKTATSAVTVKHGNMILTPKKDATCTAQGKLAYYTCETCGKYFEDEAGTREITNLDEYGIIAAISHSLAKTEAKAATCTEDGNTEYWTCGTCGKIFGDAAGKTEITLAETVIPVTNHNYKDGKCTVCGDTDPNYQEPTRPTKDEPATESNAENTKDSTATKSSTPQTSDALFGYAIFFAALIVLASVVSVVAYRKLHTVQAKHSSSNKH